jgi:1,4-alpha-glucan branching enzyme
VHGKRSLLERMPGDDWQKFANLRAYFASMYCHPGKKLLFMGAELAQRSEWRHDASLDWHLLEQPLHAGVQRLIRELNAVYTHTPALYEIDFEPRGFEWLDIHDRDNSIFAWLRRAEDRSFVVCIMNMTPVVRYDYRVGVPQEGGYAELINTDATKYGGSGLANSGVLTAENFGAHGHPHSLRLLLPPLATIVLGSARVSNAPEGE